MWGVGPSSMVIHGVNPPPPPPLPNSYRIFTQDCHVLLVDNNSEALRATSTLLESCYYQVTAVESGLHAMSMLTKRKQHFDILLTDAHLVDVDVFILLQEAFNLDIPTIFMSVEEDPVIARTSIESGVSFFLEKPVNWTSVKGLWQFVMREKSVKSQRSSDYGRYDDGEGNYSEGDNELMDNRGRKMKHVSKRKRVGVDGSWEAERRNRNRQTKKKSCTSWTEELHAKFIAAVDELGEGRCYPKEILQLMNVKGLTRMQVASHLQKCRNDNWRAPDSRKSQANNNAQANAAVNQAEPNEPNKITMRKFGSMPRLAKTSNHSAPNNASQCQSNTQGYLPGQNNNSSLGVLLAAAVTDHHHHHQGGSSYKIHQMETNFMNNEQTTNADVGINFGGQMVNGRRGTDDNTAPLFLDMGAANHHHHPTHVVESNFGSNSIMTPADQPSHQNPLVDDFFDFIPEASEASQGGYPKVFNFGSSSCNGGTYTFEPFHFNQNQGN